MTTARLAPEAAVLMANSCKADGNNSANCRDRMRPPSPTWARASSNRPAGLPPEELARSEPKPPRTPAPISSKSEPALPGECALSSWAALPSALGAACPGCGSGSTRRGPSGGQPRHDDPCCPEGGREVAANAPEVLGSEVHPTWSRPPPGPGGFLRAPETCRAGSMPPL